ncbi:MAG: hypothetical protein Q9222_001992 [Ikaeria aurantiellina]
MNLATGVKEARLNVPELEGGNDVPSALTIIDSPSVHKEASEKNQRPPADEEAIQAEPPLRPSDYSIADSTLYASSILAIKPPPTRKNENLSTALSNLEDLAHSYHWGLTIAKDEILIHELYRLLLPVEDISIQVRSLATLALGTAIHNNEAALNAALSYFYNDEWPEGPLEAAISALSTGEKEPLLLNRMIFLLSSLCRDSGQRRAFFDRNGIGLLLELYSLDFIPGDREKEKVRRKITNFVVDYMVPSNELDKMEDQTDLGYQWTMKHLQYAQDERQRIVLQPQ